MSDLTTTIAPKSDRLNADDLIGVPSKTIKITKVSIAAGDQPVSLGFEGDNGKPWYPCKSMRRVLVQIWGGDGNKYVGQSLTLYRDENVKFGGANVGGIRISHMSGITESVTMALTATRAQRKPYTVKPLPASQPSKPVDTSAFDVAIKKVIESQDEVTLNLASEEGRALKGWPKDKASEMKKAIESTKARIQENAEIVANEKEQSERQPGE